jgi:hypothetical protein
MACRKSRASLRRAGMIAYLDWKSQLRLRGSIRSGYTYWGFRDRDPIRLLLAVGSR